MWEKCSARSVPLPSRFIRRTLGAALRFKILIPSALLILKPSSELPWTSAVFAAAAPDEPRMERAAAARMPFTAFFDMLFMSLTSPEDWCRHGAGGSGRDSPRGSRGATEARSLNDTPLMIFYQTWRISSVKGGRFSPCHGEAPSLCLPGACSRQQHPPSQHAECMKEAECGIAVKKICP